MHNLPGTRSNVPRAVVLQLARLGDLVQTLPVLSALRCRHPTMSFDLLCPAPLVSLAALFPDVSRVLPWRAEQWQILAQEWNGDAQAAVARAASCFESYPSQSYPLAYNLNNHPRAIVAAHLLSPHVRGVVTDDPLSSDLNPWARYVRLVAAERGNNPIHLIDAWCGLCGVLPPDSIPVLTCDGVPLPRDLERFQSSDGLRVAVVVGAGDADRRIPLAIWAEWITTLLMSVGDAQVLLVGGPGERALALSLLDRVPAGCLGRIWDACGRLGFPELVAMLSRCQWVVGSDTGPVHVGAACGARVMAFYFSHARVHETGPYGEGHWIWQAVPSMQHRQRGSTNIPKPIAPTSWPIGESLDVLVEHRCTGVPPGWSLWSSHHDAMGAWYKNEETQETYRDLRTECWSHLNNDAGVDWRHIRALLARSDTLDRHLSRP